MGNEKMIKLSELIQKDKHLVLEKIFGSMFDIVFIVDAEFNILQASPSIKALGYSPDEVELKSIFILANDNTVLNKMFENPSNGHKYVEVVPLTDKNKQIVHYEMFCTKLKIEEEELFIAIASDVSAKLLAESELKKHSENIEAQLKQERQFRLDQDKFGLQKSITRWLIFLIGFMILVPYIGGTIFTLPSDWTNSTFNVVLMLVGSLAVAVSSIFNTKAAENNNSNNNNIQTKK